MHKVSIPPVPGVAATSPSAAGGGGGPGAAPTRPPSPHSPPPPAPAHTLGALATAEAFSEAIHALSLSLTPGKCRRCSLASPPGLQPPFKAVPVQTPRSTRTLLGVQPPERGQGRADQNGMPSALRLSSESLFSPAEDNCIVKVTACWKKL